MVSFCGYFPSEKPKYSCLVCIVKKGTPASGGGQCGPVFREISQYLMTKDKYYDARSIGKDNESNSPSVAHGHRDKAQQVLDLLDSDEQVPAGVDSVEAKPGAVPNLTGMGARDAVQALQDLGLRARVNGKGRVVKQSVAPGVKADKGHTVTLTLE